VQLRPEAEVAGFRLLSVDTTESTNDDAFRAAVEGDQGRLWIVAEEQRKGRGRHGRFWMSPPGNLYASLLLVDPCEVALAPQLGFVAGLALHEAVEELIAVGAPRLTLKWPNDLLLDGAKVAGLLLEGHRIGTSGTFAVVIGFGVNVAFAPQDTPYPAVALQSCRPELTREALFGALSSSFAGSFAAWKSGQSLKSPDSFAAIRQLWSERAAGIGTDVRVRLPAGERRGRFDGLDRHGRLRLITDAGLELIDAGDLYFPTFSSDMAEAAPARQGCD
jgi:BirA family transcriptional regulator, biotin operon repressor / biotin---[acetyl-CoA-carboxylase] ligase